MLGDARSGPLTDADAVDELPQAPRSRPNQILCAEGRLVWHPSGCAAMARRRVDHRSLLPVALDAVALGASAVSAGRALLLEGGDALRDLPGADEGKLENPHRTPAVTPGLILGEGPVLDDAGAHRIGSGPPLSPAGNPHRPCELGWPNLASRPPRPERELGHDEPADDVRDPARAQTRFPKRGQHASPDGGEPLVGKGLHFDRVGDVAHGRGTLSMWWTGRLVAIPDRAYPVITE